MPTTPHRTWPTSPCQFYYITYVKFYITSLPYPYDMGVYDSLKLIMCMRNCLGPHARKRGVFSPYDTVEDPTFLAHETEVDSMKAKSVRTRKNCQTLCKFRKSFHATRDAYFDTFNEGPYDSFEFHQHNGTIGLWFTNTDHYVTETEFHPELRIVDLIIFVGSLFSVWFGFSVIQLIDWSADKVLSEKAASCLSEADMLRKLNSLDDLIRKSERSLPRRLPFQSKMRMHVN